MLHSTYIGFFDRMAASKGNLIVARPLDMSLVQAMFSRIGTYDQTGLPKIGVDRLSFESNYLRCLDFVATRQAAEFIASVAEVAACDMLFLELNKFYTPAEYLHVFDLMDIRRRQAQERHSRGSRMGTRSNPTAPAHN